MSASAAGHQPVTVPAGVGPARPGDSAQERAADTRARAVHVLMSGGVVWYAGQLGPLLPEEAGRAVAALSAAGLLRDCRPLPAVLRAPIRVEDAQALYDQRRQELKCDMTVVVAGTVRLVWNRSAAAFITSDHRGQLYQGTDLAAAVAAFNEAVEARP